MDKLELEKTIKNFYGNDKTRLNYQQNRFANLVENHKQKFNEVNCLLFSTPGRTEIGGNHTDHNHGRVLAASVNLDSIAAVSKNSNDQVTLFSEGYAEPFVVNLKELTKIKNEEGDTKSLIRGIAARFQNLGYNIGGFNAVMTSDVLPGSGLSSSASVEVLIGNIFNVLFNNGTISNEELAIIGQYAENNYFGKPCGLMDQMACSVGGIIAIDFKDNDNPLVEKIDFDFHETKYNLIVVDTGGNHTDLTEDYASIPAEMKSVANYFGKSFCREITYNEIIENISQLRLKLGDRTILRALHFIGENERVVEQTKVLKEKDFPQFMALVKESGNSSFKWLQNIYTNKNVQEQGVSLALAITENFIEQKGNGVCRVHGGGFAGTIQVFIHENNVEEYIEIIEKVFDKGSAIKLSIRNEGTVLLSDATTI